MRASSSSFLREQLVPSDNRSRRRHGQGYQQEIELSSRQRYQPPTNAKQKSPFAVVEGYSIQPSSYREHQEPPLHNPYHHHHEDLRVIPPSGINHHNSLQRNNPAKDLSWSLCSHGILCLQCVRTQEVGIVENCGAFQEIIGPGLYCGGFWPFSVIVARLSLRVQQLDVHVETKTSDDVFCQILISVQFRILIERAYDAYYQLTDTHLQIRTYVYDAIRSTIPRMELDQVFESKTEISDKVFLELQSVMKHYGYEIVSTPVARVTPNELVKYSMNEVNASRRSKEAVPYKAEANKIEKLKKAEAHAESLHLHGIGIAKERNEIAKGLKSCILDCSAADIPTTTRAAMELLLVSQYLDTLVAVGADQLLIQGSPKEILDIQKSLPQEEHSSPTRDLFWE